MHKKNGYEYKLIVLNYSPNLRLFLHRHDLFESDYWSVFDVHKVLHTHYLESY
ncbi:accessory Sec system glycosyltransferase Asp1 [Staphylococcus warneri]